MIDHQNHHQTNKTEAKILSIVKNQKEVKFAEEKDEVYLITNQTSFYAESGGQVGDKGFIKTENGYFEVLDTQKFFNNF